MLLVSVIAAAPAFAQASKPPKAEVAGGYQFIRVEGDNLKKGWFADVAIHTPKVVSIVGQFSQSSMSVSESGVTGTASIREIAGGIRASSWVNPKVTPFAQVLAGGMTAKADVKATVGSASATFKDSETDFGMQFGGGLNIAASKNIGIRLNADFVRVFHGGGEHTNFYRLAAGAVVPIGKR
jgi:opacity protein-like surface antigen